MTTISMSGEELAIAHYIASVRQHQNDAANVNDRRVSRKDDSFEINRVGMIGEMALAKHLNVYPDFSPSPRAGSPDMFLGPTSIDAKCSKHPHANLIVTEKTLRSDESDVYVLVRVNKEDNTACTLVGWWMRDQIVSSFWNDSIPTPAYLVPAADLWEMELLAKYCTEVRA